MGSYLILRNELFKEAHVLAKKETLLGRGAQSKSSRLRAPGQLLCHVARSLGFYGDGLNFWVFSCQSLLLRVLPGGMHVAQPRWIPVRRILGEHMDWSRLSSF